MLTNLNNLKKIQFCHLKTLLHYGAANIHLLNCIHIAPLYLLNPDPGRHACRQDAPGCNISPFMPPLKLWRYADRVYNPFSVYYFQLIFVLAFLISYHSFYFSTPSLTLDFFIHRSFSVGGLLSVFLFLYCTTESIPSPPIL